MLRFTDVVKLAYTKLRTRRLRLFISLFVASLLFGALMLGTIVVSGMLASVESFSRDGFSSRYIVAGIDRSYDFELANDEALIARATQLQKDEIAAKKAAAKRLGVVYEETFEQVIGETIITDPSSGHKSLNITAPLAQKAIAEAQANEANLPSLDKFKNQVDKADKYYVGLNRSGFREYQPTLTIIKDGKEQVDVNKGGVGLGYGYSNGMSSGLGSMTSEWNLLDKALLEPFLLPGQNLDIGNDGSIPIVASYSASQEVLKLTKLTRNATAEERKQRLEDVRKRIAGQTFEVCYRNYTSEQYYQEAVQQQQLLEMNKDKRDFVKPNLIYKLSDIPCSDPIIDKDTRSVEEKRYDIQKEKFDREFGEPASHNEILKFRIVGVTQDSPYGSEMSGSGSFGAMDIIYGITSSSLGAKWVSPLSVQNTSPSVQDVFAANSAYVFGSQNAYFAEYSNAEAARKALKERDCRVDYGGPVMDGQDTSLPACSVKGERSFSLMPYGSASLAIDDFRQAFRGFQMWAALIVGGVASVILMGVIGRIIADARKETAVFRATGASRLMIAQIYVMYTLFLVVIMILISMAIGIGLALLINHQYSPDASVNMALLFNVDDLSKQFTFYGLDFYDIGLISVSILVAAIVASSVPISGNIQRNPINDMRNE